MVERKSVSKRLAELREAGYGTLEASRIIKRQDLDREIMEAKTVDDLKGILWSIVARL